MFIFSSPPKFLSFLITLLETICSPKHLRKCTGTQSLHEMAVEGKTPKSLSSQIAVVRVSGKGWLKGHRMLSNLSSIDLKSNVAKIRLHWPLIGWCTQKTMTLSNVCSISLRWSLREYYLTWFRENVTVGTWGAAVDLPAAKSPVALPRRSAEDRAAVQLLQRLHDAEIAPDVDVYQRFASSYQQLVLHLWEVVDEPCFAVFFNWRMVPGGLRSNCLSFESGSTIVNQVN